MIQERRLLPFFYNLIAVTLGYKSVKSLRVTKILKETKVGEVQDDLESKKFFQTQAGTKYLRLTLVSM